MHKLTHEYVASEYSKRKIRLLSPYIHSGIKDRLECMTCGHRWEAIYLKNGYGCPKCAIQGRNSKNRKSALDAIETKSIINRDQIKRELCLKHGIHLIEIPFWEKDIKKLLQSHANLLGAQNGLL